MNVEKRLLAGLAALMLAAPLARAQETSGLEAVLVSRFSEAYTAGDLEKADRAFQELTQSFPLWGKDRDTLLRYADTLFREGKKTQAAEELKTVLDQDQENIQALSLLALIRAGQKDKPQSQEEAKDLLVSAARSGAYVLRLVRTSKGKELDYLRNDPRFILQCMQASREFLAPKSARNPFAFPRVGGPPATGKDEPITASELAELKKRIEADFQAIEDCAETKAIEKLPPLFKDLSQLMTTFKERGRALVAAEARVYEKRLSKWAEIRLVILLEGFVAEGNEHLVAMLRAKDAERWDEVFDHFAQVKDVVLRMRREERAEFHANADALLARAQRVDADARKLKKIKELNFVVTGIVVDPRPESKNKAIIVFDDATHTGSVYEEDEELRDRDGNKVPGLRVVKISEGSIRFRYDDTDFVRPLKAP
jgi:hypothetical protein